MSGLDLKCYFGRIARKFDARRAAVAMIVALSAPVLIGFTGFAVDSNYWFATNEALQSAADAAAITAAMNDQRLAEPTAASKTSAATPLAIAAADNATNGQFGFASGASGASLTLNALITTNAKGQSVTSYVATAQIPRPSFLTVVLPIITPALKPQGEPADYQPPPPVQSAVATATLDSTTTLTGGGCVVAFNAAKQQAVYAVGGAQITAANCGVFANSNAANPNNGDADAIVADPSASITGSTVSAVGSIYANRNGGAYVGATGGTAANNYNLSQNAAALPDPLAAMGTAPAWPAMPSVATASSYNNVSGDLSKSYQSYPTTASGAWGSCDGNGDCALSPASITGLNNISIKSLTLNAGTSSGASIISGGISGGTNALTLNGSAYNISGGVALSCWGGSGSGMFFNGNNYNISNSASWAVSVNCPVFNFGTGTGGSYIFNGGLSLSGSSPVATLASGTYMFSAYKGSTNGAFYDSNANLTFAGGTYYFDGGLNIVGNGSVTFGPGIYYIRNGNLNFGAGSKITANGATFVLEGNASYQMSGGSAALNLTAPSSNCVAPSSYPQSQYISASPYDGTNNEGICGVLIYQARGDSTPDAIVEGANSTITGIIYAPSAPLSISGGASLAAAPNADGSAGTLAVLADSIMMTGSGTLHASAAANSLVAQTATTTTQALLSN
jgi:hypothetical protein